MHSHYKPRVFSLPEFDYLGKGICGIQSHESFWAKNKATGDKWYLKPLKPGYHEEYIASALYKTIIGNYTPDFAIVTAEDGKVYFASLEVENSVMLSGFTNNKSAKITNLEAVVASMLCINERDGNVLENLLIQETSNGNIAIKIDNAASFTAFDGRISLERFCALLKLYPELNLKLLADNCKTNLDKIDELFPNREALETYITKLYEDPNITHLRPSIEEIRSNLDHKQLFYTEAYKKAILACVKGIEQIEKVDAINKHEFVNLLSQQNYNPLLQDDIVFCALKHNYTIEGLHPLEAAKNLGLDASELIAKFNKATADGNLLLSNPTKQSQIEAKYYQNIGLLIEDANVTNYVTTLYNSDNSPLVDYQPNFEQMIAGYY